MTIATTTIVPVQPKWVAKSLTFWGALTGLVATLYQVGGPVLDGFGVTLPVGPQEIEAAKNVGTNVITMAGGIFGFALAIFGRFKAGKKTSPISALPSSEPSAVPVVVKPASKEAVNNSR